MNIRLYIDINNLTDGDVLVNVELKNTFQQIRESIVINLNDSISKIHILNRRYLCYVIHKSKKFKSHKLSCFKSSRKNMNYLGSIKSSINRGRKALHFYHQIINEKSYIICRKEAYDISYIMLPDNFFQQMINYKEVDSK
jgi:hypothetical protein